MTSRSPKPARRAYRTLAQIQARPYAPRHRRDTMTPAQLLAALPLGHRDWKRILASILAIHGREHGTKDKVVSNQTMYERPRFLFQFFEELHTKTIYHTVEPRCLGNRHVAAMVAIWAGRGLSAGTIANYLSMLRVFVAWIGKDPSIVRTAAEYLGSDSVLAHRHQVAEEDHSWIAAGVVHAEVLEQIRTICPYVAIQTEFSKLFGLRPREARCLRPHEAVILRKRVLPRDVDASSPATHYLHFDWGTKGGRPRDVPIETDAQWDLVRRAQAFVRPGRHLGRPGYTLKQNKAHFYRVAEKVGITKKESGVTPHGLRHEFANDVYEKEAGVASPVRGGSAPDRETDRAARLAVSRLLGHHRGQVTGSYCGSPRVSQPAKVDSTKADRSSGNDIGDSRKT
jgi:integrase